MGNWDMLNDAIERGIINFDDVRQQIELKKREELLRKHTNKIWQGKDGKWYTYLPDKEKGRVLKKKGSRQAIEEEVIHYFRQEEENPALEEVFQEWIDRRLKLKKISPATHLRYCQEFQRHYKDFGKSRIKSIVQEDIIQFLEEQIAEFNLSAKAFSNLKGITRNFLKYAKRQKLISWNVEELFQELDVSERDFSKTIKESNEQVFDEAETAAMMKYLTENLDLNNLAILLMFVSGARVGEIVALKHSDFGEDYFQVRRTETKYKTENGYVYRIKDFPKSAAGVRTVVIPESYLWILRKVKATNPFCEYVFCKDGKRISTQAVRMRLKRICEKLNIRHKSPHKIRATYATILLDSHVDNKLITQQLGHTNISCTEDHYHRNRRSIDAKRQILSAIPEFAVKDIQHTF